MKKLVKPENLKTPDWRTTYILSPDLTGLMGSIRTFGILYPLIATEDERFFSHSGIDFIALIRVLRGVLTGNSNLGGGSTITQQLARTVFLNQDKSLVRKIKEAALAYKLERKLSKNEILEQYLNLSLIHI